MTIQIAVGFALTAIGIAALTLAIGWCVHRGDNHDTDIADHKAVLDDHADRLDQGRARIDAICDHLGIDVFGADVDPDWAQQDEPPPDDNRYYQKLRAGNDQPPTQPIPVAKPDTPPETAPIEAVVDDDWLVKFRADMDRIARGEAK